MGSPAREIENGASLRLRRSRFLRCSLNSQFFTGYFFAFFAPGVGTVAMVCKMRLAIL